MDLVQETLLFFQNMKNHFIKRGKKETMENYFRNSLFARSKTKKPNYYNLLSNAMLNSTPFVNLKEKKRRRYSIYKVHPVEIEWSRRKALSYFARAIKEQSTKNLFARVEKELILLSTGKSSIQAKRDAYHKLAFRWSPYRWRRLLIRQRKKQEALKRRTQEKERKRGEELTKLKKEIELINVERLKLSKNIKESKINTKTKIQQKKTNIN